MNQLATSQSSEGLGCSESASSSAGRWLAGLELVFEHDTRGCRLAKNHHRGPLYVQKPFFPEGRDLAHIYLLHPPGGLVSGDQLDIRITVAEYARALVTTTGAGRVYRARGDGLLQRQNTLLQIAAGASLEWLPLENIAYPGANGSMHTRVNLEPGALFAGWEVTSLGLPARGESFHKSRLHQRLEIFLDGVPLLLDSLRLGDPAVDMLRSKAGLSNFPVNGMMVMGPFAESVCDDAMAECRQILARGNTHCLGGVTLVANMLVVRVLGRCAFEVRELLSQTWCYLRPQLLGRSACAPRIWRT
ncbi:urease accessory protein UreD [Microbulbifer agarilyticus]|uniref:urease accessory protein UreD n=1 Tax=Microbulbifer agarilyticus TaxID=260552 RepID=UPI001C97FD78|nr:urease accessory protein UreD [Microbulbifer agarilyticus]MBY6190230.1 urease accessory protein UreD [Microbulbifer agarilyticus]MCA0892725.1 urease accessory protein UreD [Microbulbifer agarilyticus]